MDESLKQLIETLRVEKMEQGKEKRVDYELHALLLGFENEMLVCRANKNIYPINNRIGHKI